MGVGFLLVVILVATTEADCCYSVAGDVAAVLVDDSVVFIAEGNEVVLLHSRYSRYIVRLDRARGQD